MTVLDVIRALLNGNTGILETILSTPGAQLITMQIVALAGLSESLGNSVILFANRVSPRRFVLSLFFSVIVYIGGFFVWVFSIWLAARLVFERTTPMSSVATAVSLSYIPLLFSFLTLLPYLGGPIIKALYLLTFFALVGALEIALGLNEWEALMCSLFGGLFNLLLRSTIGRPITWLENRLKSWVAGRPLQDNLRAVIEDTRRDLARRNQRLRKRRRR
ncbi:MAG: hypothetical protein Kow0077_27110 [Anaerolineae bacterium]